MDEAMMGRKLKQLSAELIETIEWHEESEHGGSRCPDERANVIAFLAHGLMLTVDEWVKAMDIFGEYLSIHEEHLKEHK